MVWLRHSIWPPVVSIYTRIAECFVSIQWCYSGTNRIVYGHKWPDYVLESTHAFYFYLYIALGAAVSIGTPAEGTVTATKGRSLWYIFWCWWIYTDRYRSATEIRGMVDSDVSAGKLSQKPHIVTNTCRYQYIYVDDNDLTGIATLPGSLYSIVIHDNWTNGGHYTHCFQWSYVSPVTIGGNWPSMQLCCGLNI